MGERSLHIGYMAGTGRKDWEKLIAEQEGSGLGVPQFCREHGVCAPSFYQWRKRLRVDDRGVQFALVETATTASGAIPLELIFINGERLRIGKGVDAATLRLTLEAIRG